MKKTCVVPSCRAHSLAEWLRAWDGIGDWDELIVVEDGPRPTFELPAAVVHYCWQDVRDILGPSAWIVSRRDSAVRGFGLLMAYVRGAGLVVTLDDDCYPDGERPICAGHLAAMESHPRWIESIPGMRTRGLPYRNRGRLHVAANMGLWRGVPDLDAIQSLASPPAGDYTPPAGSRVVPGRQYVPLCGMNLAVRREAIPLFYFPPMGEAQPYRRFDDIWAGVIAQKVLDHLGWSLAVGEPFVHHVRASDPLVNLVKEAPGIAAHEELWPAIDSAVLAARTPAACMDELGRHLVCRHDAYASRLGEALRVWASLFAGSTP